jgi:hypothetical protein
VTDQEPQDTPAVKPAPTRHRRSAAIGAGITAWLSAGDRPGRRALVVGGVLVAVLLLVLGYVAFNVRGDSGKPPSAAPSTAPVTPPTPGGSADPGGGPSADPGGSADPGPGDGTPRPGEPEEPSDPTSPSPGATAPPTESGEAPPAERPAPKLVGPKDLDGFTKLLSAFCRDRGDRTAVLLEGPKSNRATGDWACVKITTLTRINLDDACRDSFGDAAQARETKRGDSRTWRCFDS